MRFDKLYRRPKFCHRSYVSPMRRSISAAEHRKEKLLQCHEMYNSIQKEILGRDPSVSPERLRATVFRFFDEGILRIRKESMEPSFARSVMRPIISLTCVDRRYREWYHTGSYTKFTDGTTAWSCCRGSSMSCQGCEYKVVNPDAWSVYP